MKKQIITISICLISFMSFAQLDTLLIHKLDSLDNEDQTWRKHLIAFYNGELDTITYSLNAISSKLQTIDSLNYFELKTMFEQYGFPNYDIVGKEGSHNFWELVQHQDKHPEFMDSVLTKMKIEVDAKKANGKDYALLLDRTKVNAKQKQVYGTQFTQNEKGKLVLLPVINPKKLNERRFSVGLNSIEEYTKHLEELYRNFSKKD